MSGLVVRVELQQLSVVTERFFLVPELTKRVRKREPGAHVRPRLDVPPELTVKGRKLFRSDRPSARLDTALIPLACFLRTGARVTENHVGIGTVW